ncbi:MAG: phosphoserine phosphatase SerB [Planctomycetes bacterium]|nr:phosphoserine phosphatase SerB [Planctomycetota bacterium]
MPSPDIRALWASAKAVCFDVDSTVSPDEGIDVLAAQAGVGDRVAELTRNAMGGSVLFQDALKARLDLIRPSQQLIADCLTAHPPRLTPGIGDLIAKLERRGTHVYLISGGFTHMILPLAKHLALPQGRVIANVLHFAPDGSYAGFDENAFTSRSGGKGTAIRDLKNRFGYAPLIMVGDGATDLEARPPADGFIGYGGIVVREKVKAGADWFVTDFAELVAALDAPGGSRHSTTQT